MLVQTSATPADDEAGSGYGRRGEHALSVLRYMIASGQLRPGEHLRQDDLAQRIGTTRVPVREAFKTLLAENVLVHRRNQGHFVAKLTSHELWQLCWLREVIEDEVVRTAQWPDAAMIAHLRSLNEQIRIFGERGKSHDFNVIETDRALHFSLWELSPLHVLRRELTRVWRLIEPYELFMPYFKPPMVERSIAEHAAIIDAIERQDRPAYRDLLAEHRSLIYKAVSDLADQEVRAGEAGIAQDFQPSSVADFPLPAAPAAQQAQAE